MVRSGTGLLAAWTAACLLSHGCSPMRDSNEIRQELDAKWPAKAIDTPLTAAEIAQDVDTLVRTVDEVHPDPYRVVDKRAFHEAAGKLKQRTEPMTIKAFYDTLAPLVISLGHDHTYVEFPWNAYHDYASQGGLVFPLDVLVEGRGLLVRANHSSNDTVAPGATIRSINNMKAERILDDLLRYCHGSTRYIKTQKRLPVYFPALMWHLYGPQEAFSIDVDGRVHEVKARTRKQIDQARQTQTSRQPGKVGVQYKRLNKGIGLLVVDGFAQEDFPAKLKKAFATIKQEGVQRLIVDVRDNTGGSTTQVEQLLDYLTDQPYRTASFTVQRRSRQMDAFLDKLFVWWFRPLSRLHPLIGAYYKTPIGKNSRIEMDMNKPTHNPRRFSGKLYVLIGPNTYSAGTEFVVAVKDHGIGTLIGEATGGPANGDGNALEFVLPNSRLRASCATNFQIRPSGRQTQGGVQPDVEVSPLYRGDRDLALEKARALARRET